MRQRAGLRALAALAVLGIVAAVLASHLWPRQVAVPVAAAVQAMQDWGRRSWPLFVALQVLIALSGVVPASMVGLAAGAVYGPVIGMLVASASTLAAAAIAFAVARSALRGPVAAMLARRGALLRIDRAITRDGWRMVCLLRVSPVMPFALTSYALGLTGLSLRDYIIGTLAALPALACTVLLGWLGRLGAGGGRSALQWCLLALGIAATCALAVHVGRLLQRALPAQNDNETDKI